MDTQAQADLLLANERRNLGHDARLADPHNAGTQEGEARRTGEKLLAAAGSRVPTLDKHESPAPPSDAPASDATTPSKSSGALDAAGVSPTSQFPWQHIGLWDSPPSPAGLQLVQEFIVDQFYTDWYYNTILVIGTCFFSWLVARLNLGLGLLVLVLLCLLLVYRAEFRRFNRNIRDDLVRENAMLRLETQLETMEWMNSFLAKFWAIYMNELTRTVKAQAKAALENAAPGMGIDKLTLTEFTLGNKAPKVEMIKTYPNSKGGAIEMDWKFLFTPMDEEGMTKAEKKAKINPLVNLEVRLGKGIVSKGVDVTVADMLFSGLMNIKLHVGNNFPHVKTVLAMFLQPPEMKYKFMPAGTALLGLDIMLLVPGLSSFVELITNGVLGPMMYAPNAFTVDVELIMEGMSGAATGMVAITVLDASTTDECLPYVRVYPASNPASAITTTTKQSAKSFTWNETQYVLVNSLTQQLELEVHDASGNVPVLAAQFDMREFLQDLDLGLVLARLMQGVRTLGDIRFQARWFPVAESEELEDGTVQHHELEAGILRLTVHSAKDLDVLKLLLGSINPQCVVKLNKKQVLETRALRNNTEPGWEETVEVLVTQRTHGWLSFKIHDAGSMDDDNVVGAYSGALDDLLFAVSSGRDVVELLPKGLLRLTAKWKPLVLGDDSDAVVTPPVGALRVEVREAHDVLNLETVGLVDPYVKVLLQGRLCARTPTIPDTLDPVWNCLYWIPVASTHQHVLLDVYDFQNLTKDRLLGLVSVAVGDYVRRGSDGAYEGIQGDVVTANLALKGKEKGQIHYRCAFVPAIPLLTRSEKQDQKKRAKEAEDAEAEWQRQVAEWQALERANPGVYEWVDEDLDQDDDGIPNVPRVEMLLEECMQHTLGTLTFKLVGGMLQKPQSYVQFVLDEQALPLFVSTKSDGRRVVQETGEAFVRDLPNSKLYVRVASKVEVTSEDHVLGEAVFDTARLLRDAYNKPITLRVGGLLVLLQTEYIPLAQELDASDRMEDTGKLECTIVLGSGLMSADSNGKLDPYCKIIVDGEQVAKTDKIKRTLDPKWNYLTLFVVPLRLRLQVLVDVYDWDALGEDDHLGNGVVDLSGVGTDHPTTVHVKLGTQGSVELSCVFKPQYIRAPVGAARAFKGVKAVGDLAGMGVGAVTGVADVGVGAVTGVAGAGVGAAGAVAGVGAGAVKKVGGGLLRFGSSRKSEDAGSIAELRRSGGASAAGSSGNGTHGLPGGASARDLLRVEEERRSHDAGSRSRASSSPTKPSSQSLAPPQAGHARTGLTLTTLLLAAGLVVPEGAVPGQVLVLHAVAEGDHVYAKVLLVTGGKEKSVHKTRAVKPRDGSVQWNDLHTFKLLPEATLRVQVLDKHTFGSDKPVAVAEWPLEALYGKDEELSQGGVTVRVVYG